MGAWNLNTLRFGGDKKHPLLIIWRSVIGSLGLGLFQGINDYGKTLYESTQRGFFVFHSFGGGTGSGLGTEADGPMEDRFGWLGGSHDMGGNFIGKNGRYFI